MKLMCTCSFISLSAFIVLYCISITRFIMHYIILTVLFFKSRTWVLDQNYNSDVNVQRSGNYNIDEEMKNYIG